MFAHVLYNPRSGIANGGHDSLIVLNAGHMSIHAHAALVIFWLRLRVDGRRAVPGVEQLGRGQVGAKFVSD